MKRRIAFDVGGRSVGPPSLGGAMANPTEDVVCYLKGISRAGQAMARFPRRPDGPPRSASVRTIRMTRSQTVLREFGWFERMVTEGVTSDPGRNLAIAWPISDSPGSWSEPTCLESTQYYQGDGGQTLRRPSPAATSHPTQIPPQTTNHPHQLY